MAQKVANIQKSSEETRSERFRRVATRRTNDILNRLRVLGNCSNKSSYAYTEDEVNKIFSALEKELRTTKSMFGNRKKRDFTL